MKKEDTLFKRTFLGLIILSGIAFIAPIGFYIYKFSSYPISTEPEAWGPFGDFFGGLLNPIFAFANLIAFLMLTFYIHKIEKNTKEREIKYQRKLIKSSSKYDIFKELNHSSYKIAFLLLRKDENLVAEVTVIYENCYYLINDIKDLFPEVGLLVEEIDAVKLSFDNFLENIDEKSYEQINRDLKIIASLASAIKESLRLITSKLNVSIQNDLDPEK